MYNSAESLVGTFNPSDSSRGFKDDVAHIIDAYDTQGVSLIDNMSVIARDKSARRNFVEQVLESVNSTPVFTNGDASNDPFYSSYGDRLDQLIDNSMVAMATESVMNAYAPIQSYAPFMIKRQWVSCVWKDVLAADVAKSNIIKLAVEQRFVRDGDGTPYQIPDVYYNKTLMTKLLEDSTGVALKETPITLPLQHVCLIDPSKNTGDTATTYFKENLVVVDASNTLTHDYTIFQVIFKDSENEEHTVPVDIKPDLSSHTLINGNNIRCTVLNEDGSIKETLVDDIVGNVDFETGSVTVMATRGKIVKICQRGKAANRFNHRSLTVERQVKPLTFYMPESGPRLNATVTVEDAQDAIACGNIDLYADNTDMMGDVLANLQDIGIKSFVDNSFDVHNAMLNGPLGYAEKFTGEGSFNAVPLQNFSITIDQWMNQAKEYFERLIDDLAYKLKTSNIIVCAVCHPKLVRYLKTDVRWIFDDQTDVSGVKISYKCGITTASDKKIHLITSTYMSEDSGVKIVVIPTTTEAITFKHIMHSAIIDRGYQNPLEPLVPNVMATQRTLTFEVTPVQGNFYITGRGTTAPTSYAGTLNVTNTLANIADTLTGDADATSGG